MCRDTYHGGRRCISDTSEARRLRRKASKILKTTQSANAAPIETLPVTEPTPLEALKSKAEELRQKVHAAPVDDIEAQAKYDSEMEQEITNFGLSIAGEADKLAGYSRQEQEEKLSKLETEIYGEVAEKLRLKDVEIEKTEEDNEELIDQIEQKFGYESYKRHLDYIDEFGLNDKEKELAVHLAKLQDERKEIADSFRSYDEKYDKLKEEIITEANTKLTEAYHTILANIRPMGGKTDFKENSSEEVKTIMEQTVALHYPASWLEAHNAADGADVILATTQTRPSFQSDTLSETEYDGVPKNTVSNATFTLSENYKKVLDDHDFSILRRTSIETKDWANNVIKVESVIYQTEEIYDPAKHGAEPPTEETGWEYKPTLKSLELPEAQNVRSEQDIVDLISAKRWVRPEVTTKKLEPKLSLFDKETSDQVSAEHNITQDDQKAMAYHEFGHRMETVLPNNILPRQEKAFLKRRSGKTTDSEFTKNLINTGNMFEFGHEGGFVSRYVGRDYFTDNNFEVFTTGIEGLFGGNYGGLVGNSVKYTPKDEDHRGFILGMLATL